MTTKGTNTEPDDQTTKNYASTNVTTRTLDLQMIMRRTGHKYYNYQLQQQYQFQQLDHHSTTTSRTPRRHPNTTTGAYFAPTVPSKRRHRARRFYPRRRPRTSRPQIDPYDDPTSLQYLSQDILDLIDDAFPTLLSASCSVPTTKAIRAELACRTDQHAPNSDQHLSHYHSNLKLDIIDMARYVCTIHMFTEDEEPIKASYSLGTIQDDVDEIIRATGNMYLINPGFPKTPTATSPTFYELYPVQPLLFSESDPEPTRTDNSTTLDSVSKFSTSSPIPDVILEISDSVKRPVNGSNASLSYCAAVDTGNNATVVRTAVSSPNPQQWACRAHNPTVSSETLTYLDVQHPVPIKLEDLPSSQADDADVFLADHCYSCSNNDSTRETVNFYPDADPDPLPEVANDPDPEPMDIVEDDLDNNGDANRDIGEPNEVPSAAIQQLVRLLPPLRLPHRCDRQPLDAIHHHPFRMFQHFHHIPSRDLFFTEAMLMDTINGTIHLRDLPLCVRTSATISAFASTHSPTHPNSTSSVASTSTSSTTSYFTSYATTCISTN
ncbi:hypothetical protein MHU86_22893 [Fragilaria crotonensis]|nr:hypothetical protein MHU86_22893 [Fragilaria crotonensis]